MKDLNQRLEQGIRDVFESERFRDYLAVMSRFHTYSARNVLLIHMQRPNATRVASAKRWKEQFERFINKGEKAIYIMAPIPIVKTVERQKLDPDTKAPVLDEDGQVITEKREVQVPRFRPVPVFDVSQTNGKPLPQLAQDLTGDVEQYEAFMEALRRTAPVPMEIKPMAENLDGYFSLDEQSISIRAGMSEVQTVCAAVHEITHSILHNQRGVREDKAVRTAQELEAESVSYVVCQYCGVETGANSFGYLSHPSRGAGIEIVRNTTSPSIPGINTFPTPTRRTPLTWTDICRPCAAGKSAWYRRQKPLSCTTLTCRMKIWPPNKAAGIERSLTLWNTRTN